MRKLVGILIGVALTLSTAAEKPNLLVIMADDLGYGDVGFNGCEDIPTPNIDRLAAQGVQCSSAYTSFSVCGPSRAGFMTGRYGQRFGFERNPLYSPEDPDMGLPMEEHTIADVLKPEGYTSGVIGKWHLGAHETLHPLNRGFDFFYGHLGGGHRYFPEDLTIVNTHDATSEYESYRTWILRNHKPECPDQYLTDQFSEEAIGFLRRNDKKPFFLFLSYNAPHVPMQASKKYLSRFPNIQDKKRRTYAAMVSAMDDGIGRVLDTLSELELDENTLVFFLSDNGGPPWANASSNGPLRGSKASVFEGGFRVPYLVRWTGQLPAGAVYERPVSALDILATIASLAGAPLDPQHPLDGVNLIPYLRGDDAGIPHEKIFIRKYDTGAYAIRQGAYKLIIPGANSSSFLYNLDEDIGEKKDLTSAFPELAHHLERALRQWEADLIPPRFIGKKQLKNDKE